MNGRNGKFVLCGIIGAIVTLLSGFGVMWLLWRTLGTRGSLPGFFDYDAAVYGDAICLTVIVGSAIAFLQYHLENVNKRMCILSAIISGGVGILIQASWLISSDTVLNWTIPVRHCFNVAGWYHSLFFIGMFATIAYLLTGIYCVHRCKKQYDFTDKVLMLMVTASGALYLLCHIGDDYDQLFVNGVAYAIVSVVIAVIMTFILINGDIKFRDVKTVIIKGLILAIGLYHIIVIRAWGTFDISLAGALAMVVYSNRENCSKQQYFWSNIPLWVGTFGIFSYLTSGVHKNGALGVFITLIVLLLAFDFKIFVGKKLNALGIAITLYIGTLVIFNINNNAYVHECLSDLFAVSMSLFFSKGIKGIFGDVIDAEQKFNDNKIPENEFNLKKTLAYMEIVALLVSLLLIIWNWMDLREGWFDINEYLLLIIGVSIAVMCLCGVRLSKSKIGIIISLCILVCGYAMMIINCCKNLLLIKNWQISKGMLCILLFAIFANIGGGLLLAYSFKRNVVILRFKQMNRIVNIISVILGIGAVLLSYITTIILAVSPSKNAMIWTVLFVFVAYWVFPMVYAFAYRMDKNDKINQVIPNNSLRGIAQDGMTTMIIIVCASYLPILFANTLDIGEKDVWGLAKNLALAIGLLYIAFSPVTFCLQNNKEHLVRQRRVAVRENRLDIWEVLRGEIIKQSNQVCFTMLPYIVLVFVKMEITRYSNNCITGDIKEELKAFYSEYIENEELYEK